MGNHRLRETDCKAARHRQALAGTFYEFPAICSLDLFHPHRFVYFHRYISGRADCFQNSKTLRMKTLVKSVLLHLSQLALGACVLGQNIPRGFVVPESTLSPDHHYGVTVPVFAERKEPDDRVNSLIDLRSGKLLATVIGNCCYDHIVGHTELGPSRWSSDGALLLWQVDGKWFPDALILLKLNKGTVQWQSDILTAAQKAILARTKEASPEKYAKAKKDNAGNGSAYPEGFTVDLAALDPIALPLKVRVALTSNPKADPGGAIIESHLEGIVESNGKFTVKEFHLGPSHWKEWQ